MSDAAQALATTPPDSITQQVADLYGIGGWGRDFCSVGPDGRLRLHPTHEPDRYIDLLDLVQGLDDRGFTTPLLLRFDDLLRTKLKELRNAFDDAIKDNDYQGGYTCVYPVKVNQQRSLCEVLREAAKELGFGLEAGSKPELLMVLGLTAGRYTDLPIVCNGFKDDEYIETCVLAAKLGRNITPIVEQRNELDLILKHATKYGVRPQIGLRIKPTAQGAGRWADSGGVRSKFGLHVSEALQALDKLKKAGMTDCLRLVHFHVGSQVCDIRRLKTAITELAHIYCELRRLGAEGLDTIDIGGGMGVDYDGSGTSTASSVNYTPKEYAEDVVYRIKATCQDAEQPHPRILSESGRAMVAHSSMLVTDVLGQSAFRAERGLEYARDIREQEQQAGQEIPHPVIDLMDAFERLATAQGDDDVGSCFHDAWAARSEAVSLFGMGYLSLPLRAVTERLFWSVGRNIIDMIDAGAIADDDSYREMRALLSDTYFCNFSLFQSLPDSWAIDQLFPICPLHRLDEIPSRRAVLADITCDSDGKVDIFCSPEGGEARGTLPLHELHDNDEGTQEPYYLGVFLVGAYQEVLGDLHNLFGDTHAVHVSLGDADAPYVIEEIIEGDTVREVIGYVGYDIEDLRKAMRHDVERATRRNRMTPKEGQELMRHYIDGLEGYTYLE